MNRLNYALAFLFFVQIGQSFSLQAQELPVAVSDTINWSAYQDGTETLYISPNGGYIFGNNGYGDLIKAQAVSSPNFGRLEKVLFKFGAKRYNSLDPNSKLVIGFYNLDGQGLNAEGNSLEAPGSELLFRDSAHSGISFSGTIFVSDIDTSGGFTELLLPEAAVAEFSYQEFAIVMGLTDLALGDTVGLMSTTDGDGGLTDMVWDKHVNGSWVSVLNKEFGWDLDVNLAIFPVLTYDGDRPVGISNVQNEDLEIYPNPSDSELTIFHSNGINGTFSLLAIDGRSLRTFNTDKGKIRKTALDVGSLPNGTYILRYDGAVGPSFKKIQVLH